MSRLPMALALAAALALVACKTDKAAPTTAPSASATANPYAIDDDEVPTSVDYEKEALESITPENLEAEVAKLEKELE